MKRVEARYTITDSEVFKAKAIEWAQKFESVIWLDSNKHHEKYSQYEGVLAIGEHKSLKTDYNDAFKKLKQFQSESKDYIFGYLGYDLKNDIEKLSSSNHDELEFPDLYFFQPKKLLFISGNNITFKYLESFEKDIDSDFKTIEVFKEKKIYKKSSNANIKLRIHKDSYLNKVKNILENIHHGDLYEVTFCQEFYSENTTINPLEVYKDLNSISKPPFATFLKLEQNYLLSASPERYLKKTRGKVISQPIKGTAKRSNSTKEDLRLKKSLENDPKERAENIMIVDLVRNDLSRIAHKGSINVEELCGIYSFKQVHQMISTISAISQKDMHPVDIVKNTFPMGSMTGAPKIAAMQIIEKEEESRRGLYSGSVGFFTPEGDFDFNVIIRSILYNHSKKYVSFSVGSAITSLASPEKELEECLLKAKAMKEVLL